MGSALAISKSPVAVFALPGSRIIVVIQIAARAIAPARKQNLH